VIFEMENVSGLLQHPEWLAGLVRSLTGLGYYCRVEEIRCLDFGVPQERRRLRIRGSLLGFLDPPAAPGGPPCSILEAINHLAPLRERRGILPEARLARIRRFEAHCGLSLCRDSHFGRASRTVTTRNATAATNDALRLRLPDGTVRSFSVREVAAIQSFPSTYSFDGVSRQRALVALGNAFPPVVGAHLSWAADLLLWRLLVTRAALASRVACVPCARPAVPVPPSPSDERVACATLSVLLGAVEKPGDDHASAKAEAGEASWAGAFAIACANAATQVPRTERRPLWVLGSHSACQPTSPRFKGAAVDLFVFGDVGGPCLSRCYCAVAAAGVPLSIADRPFLARRPFGATFDLGSCLEVGPHLRFAPVPGQ
jgi:hypothetical protein